MKQSLIGFCLLMVTGTILLFILTHSQKTAQPLYFKGIPIWPDDDMHPEQKVFVIQGGTIHIYPEDRVPEAAINDGKYLVVNLPPSGTKLYLRKGKALVLDRGALLDRKTGTRWDVQTGKVTQGHGRALESVTIQWQRWKYIKEIVKTGYEQTEEDQKAELISSFLSPNE